MSELENKVRAWLDEQGYPLEMRVACAFRRAGFRVRQSDYYRDPTTNAQREIDVVAHIDREIEGRLVRVQFMIECKLSRSKPWLMFCSSDLRLAPPARVAQRTATRRAAVFLEGFAQRKNIQDLDLFRVTEPAAYGATQAFTTGNDVVYMALTSVGAAVTAEAQEAGELEYAFFFPVVVVEGKLFSCVLQDDASISVTETSRGTLLWRNPIAGKPHTIVNILSDSYLQDFATNSAKSIDQFFALSLGHFEKVFKSSSTIGQPPPPAGVFIPRRLRPEDM
jgi:hypothetical protein